MPIERPLTPLGGNQVLDRRNITRSSDDRKGSFLTQVCDELCQQGGELLRYFLVRSMAGTRDHLNFAAPQCGNALLAQVVKADQLLVGTLQDGQRPTQRCDDGNLILEPVGPALDPNPVRAAPSVAKMSDMNSPMSRDEPGAVKLSATSLASDSLTSSSNKASIAGFGRNASAICAGEAFGGAPKMTKPLASGNAGAASITIWPPRLQPTTTASRTPSSFS